MKIINKKKEPPFNEKLDHIVYDDCKDDNCGICNVDNKCGLCVASGYTDTPHKNNAKAIEAIRKKYCWCVK